MLGKPVPRPTKDYAFPVTEPRIITLSVARSANPKLNNNHTAFYVIADCAGFELWYSPDGESPVFALLCFKVDTTFPKLKKVEEKGRQKSANPAKVPVVLRQNTIDFEHWNMIVVGMNKAKIAELFSNPAGDHAPGTEYLTRSYDWRRGNYANVHETLEWRGENGRVVVEFNEKGEFVTAEFYKPGRDPVTNIAERLQWERQKLDKLKRYVAERQAQK